MCEKIEFYSLSFFLLLCLISFPMQTEVARRYVHYWTPEAGRDAAYFGVHLLKPLVSLGEHQKSEWQRTAVVNGIVCIHSVCIRYPISELPIHTLISMISHNAACTCFVNIVRIPCKQNKYGQGPALPFLSFFYFSSSSRKSFTFFIIQFAIYLLVI